MYFSTLAIRLLFRFCSSSWLMIRGTSAHSPPKVHISLSLVGLGWFGNDCSSSGCVGVNVYSSINWMSLLVVQVTFWGVIENVPSGFCIIPLLIMDTLCLFSSFIITRTGAVSSLLWVVSAASSLLWVGIFTFSSLLWVGVTGSSLVPSWFTIFSWSFCSSLVFSFLISFSYLFFRSARSLLCLLSLLLSLDSLLLWLESWLLSVLLSALSLLFSVWSSLFLDPLLGLSRVAFRDSVSPSESPMTPPVVVFTSEYEDSATDTLGSSTSF